MLAQVDEATPPDFKDGKLMLKKFGCGWCGKSVDKNKEHYEIIATKDSQCLFHTDCFNEWEGADEKGI